MDNNMHIHEFQETVVPPTCQGSGYTLYRCNCGYERKGNFKPAGDHLFRTSEQTPASCTEPGSKMRVCQVCGETQTKTVPPLGHDYGEWAIQQYPTCTQEGTRIRKCNRCSDLETSSVKPTGHRCAPGTGRRVNGKLVDYFCENCGQTVSYAEAPPQADGRIKHYWPTRSVLLAAVCVTLLEMICMVLFDLQPGTGFINPLLAYSGPPLTVIWCTVFLFAAGKIKRSENYTRWMGIAMLMYALHIGSSNVASIVYELGFAERYELQDLLRMLVQLIQPSHAIAFLIFLAVIFFIGMKKQSWVLAVALFYTVIFVGIIPIYGLTEYTAYIIEAINSQWFHVSHAWSYLRNCTGVLSGILLYAGLVMLMIPTKNRRPNS